MKKLILLFLLIPVFAFSQEIIYEGEYVKMKKEVWENFKTAYIESEIDNEIKDSIISRQDGMIENDKKIIKNKDTAITFYKQAVADCKQSLGTVMIPESNSKSFISFGGLWIGLNSFYDFDNTEFNKNTFLNKIYNNIGIVTSTEIIINENLKFRPELDIPFSKDLKTSLSIGVLYRIF